MEMNPPIARRCIGVDTPTSRIQVKVSSPHLTSIAQDLGDLVTAMDSLAATSTRHLVVGPGLNTTLTELTYLFRRAPIPGHLICDKV